MTFDDLSWHRHGTQVHCVSMHLGACNPVVRSLRVLPALPLSLCLSTIIAVLARLRRRALHQVYNFSIDIIII